MAETSSTRPIDRFVGTITVGDRVIEFNVSNAIKTYNLEDFEEDKTHVIVICAENTNGLRCSAPYKVDPPPVIVVTPGEVPRSTNTPTKIQPGLIAGIAVAVAVLLCCCLLLLLLFLCVCWKVERGKTYWPGQELIGY